LQNQPFLEIALQVTGALGYGITPVQYHRGTGGEQQHEGHKQTERTADNGCHDRIFTPGMTISGMFAQATERAARPQANQYTPAP
jgi:hypothetical protein